MEARHWQRSGRPHGHSSAPEHCTRPARREFEAHGYLRRESEGLSGGRIVTRTVCGNQPGHQRRTVTGPRPRPRKPPRGPRRPAGAHPASRSPAYRTRLTPPPLLQQATDLLADLLLLLRRDPRLPLSARETAHLAPGVAAWFEREVSPSAVRHALTAALLARRL
ncbi:hypothetical protein [Streptomyces sp. NPDC054794]